VKAREENQMEIDLSELPIPVGTCPRCGLTLEAPFSVLIAGGVVGCLCGLRMQAGKEPWIESADTQAISLDFGDSGASCC
jgi:uncharacterized protein (UPF0212 family)